ncbi:MAG: TIGR00289 family protein [Candidatus Altiarchaeota archaeon]
MKLGVLFSGGKDSTYALYKVMEKEKILCLISMISENPESYMFHTPNILLTKLQAKAISLPLLQWKTKGVKEEELSDLESAIDYAKKNFKIEGIVTGAIASNYQKERIEKICKKLNLLCLNPLWHESQEKILYEILQKKFRVIITGIFAYPLNEKWLGKEINKEMISELVVLQKRYKINPAGEGGEIETFVLDAPFFKKEILILDSEIKAKENSGVFLIKKAKLIDKK